MRTWTDIAAIIGDLLILSTAAINLTAAIRTRPGHDRNQQSQRDGGQESEGPC
jgi:hypothetical protein